MKKSKPSEQTTVDPGKKTKASVGAVTVKAKKEEILEEVGEVLTSKQIRFCDEFIVDLNATRAAIRAGYTKKSAASQASRLLTNAKISQKILELKLQRASESGVTAIKVLKELAALGFSNIKQVVSWDADGELSVIPSDQIPDHVAAAIESIKVVKTSHKDDILNTTVTVKMHKKTPNLYLIMRHIGMLEEKESEENPILRKAMEDLKRGRD